MPKFCANLTWLFTESPLMERFARAKAAGFDAVELLSPYDAPAQDIVNQCARHELDMVLINCPPPNYTGGPQGYAAEAAGAGRFQQDFRRTVRYAKTLGAQFVHIMSGDASGPEAEALMIENLRWAAAEAPKQRLTIEPINPTDKPGYFMCDYDLALRVLDAVGAPNLGLQFDTYHAQMITGDAMALWPKLRDRVVHVQVGQTPDRSEPDAGDIDYSAFFAQLDADGFDGWVSGEYQPKGQTEDGLGWIAAQA